MSRSVTKQAENDFVNVKIKGQQGTDAGKRYPLNVTLKNKSVKQVAR